MKKITSTFIIFMVGLSIMSCNGSGVNNNTSSSETAAVFGMDATNIEQNNVRDLISDTNFSTLKLVTDDDREL